jgi:hypothetical protein
MQETDLKKFLDDKLTDKEARLFKAILSALLEGDAEAREVLNVELAHLKSKRDNLTYNIEQIEKMIEEL